MRAGRSGTRQRISECCPCVCVCGGSSAHCCRRHLVRLWLRDPEFAWKTPEVLQERWDRVYGGVTAENSVFPLEPGIRSASHGAQNGKAGSGGGQ